MESQEIAVSEYIGALLVILIITLTQVAFSCYCCYAVFWRKAAKCPCETSSKCPCAKNSDPEKNLPGTDDEITGLEEDIDDLVNEGPETEEHPSNKDNDKKKTKTKASKTSKFSAISKIKIFESNVEKKQTRQKAVSIHIEKKHETMKTPVKSNSTEYISKAKTTNIARRSKDGSIVVEVERHT